MFLWPQFELMELLHADGPVHLLFVCAVHPFKSVVPLPSQSNAFVMHPRADDVSPLRGLQKLASDKETLKSQDRAEMG